MDDRWNHGGFVAPMILAHLDRKILAIGGTRSRRTVDTTPSHAFNGHLVALINRQGGSDCETLALGFKHFKLGPVIGTRTWGGWVGIRGDKPLRDGGMITQPEFGGWDPKGKDLDHRRPRRRPRRRRSISNPTADPAATTCSSTTRSSTC